MSIAKMQKVQVVWLRRQKRQVLDLLQELSAMQIEEVDAPNATLERDANYDAPISEYEFAISFLAPYETKKKGFLEGLAGDAPVSYHTMKSVVRPTIEADPVKKCRELESELTNISDLEKNIIREKNLLVDWVGLEAPLEDLANSKKVIYFTGTITEQGLNIVTDAVSRENITLELISKDKQGALVLVAALTDAADKANQILTENGFIPAKLPVSKRTPSEEIAEIEKSMKAAKERRSGVANQAKELAAKRFDMMLVHDYFLQKKGAQNAVKKIGVTNYTFTVEGWIRQKDLKEVGKRLAAQFPESFVEPILPKEDEQAPVDIENRPAIRPFEAVTGIYGLPSYKEVDPTPLLATFFILFFGLCLGDAGYGITLSLVSFFFYRKMNPKSGAYKLLKLLFFGGIATFIAGAITGGWFGVEPAAFPEFLVPARKFLLSIRVIDPVKNPIGMLLLSLSIGVIQILFGIFISFCVKIRDKRYVDAVLDDLLWIYFLTVLIAFAVQKAGAVNITEQMGNLVLGGTVILVLTQGRKEKNILFKFGSGVLSLYKTVGYLSDILSYSRILALGLATSIIAMVINMVGMMTKDIPVVGYVIMALVLIGGHIFNLAVNVLGSFIHSSRLQFVEFFSKFLEGGGVEFDPFKRETKFVEIKD